MNYFLINLSQKILKIIKFLISLFFTSTTKHELIFYQSGFFRVPDNVDTIYITACAGGGSGGSLYNVAGGLRACGGGGSGAYCVNYPLKVIPGSEISIIVGAGGIAPTTSNGGSNGGNTYIENIALRGGRGGKSDSDGRGGGNGGFVWNFPESPGGTAGHDGSDGGFLFNKSTYYHYNYLKYLRDTLFFTYCFPGAGGGGGDSYVTTQGKGGRCGDPSSYDLPSTPTSGDYPGGEIWQYAMSGGGGASSPWGKGGKGSGFNSNGNLVPPENGSGYGSGGGGAAIPAGSTWGYSQKGGNGAPGFVYIKYYQPI